MALYWLVPATFGVVFAASNALIIYGGYEYFSRIMPSWEAIIPTKIELIDIYDRVEFAWGKFLVSSDSKNNESWWNWSYKYMPNKRFIQGDAFKKVTKGYGQDDGALNQVCAQLYAKTTSGLTDQERENLWKYCSAGRKALVTLDKVEDNDFKNPVLNDENRKLLVSTRHYSNLWWWAIRKKEFELDGVISDKYQKYQRIIQTCDDFYSSSKSKEITEEALIEVCGLPKANVKWEEERLKPILTNLYFG